MKRYAVLGAGLMGVVAAEDLRDGDEGAHVTLYDSDLRSLQRAASRLGRARVETRRVDASDVDALAAVLEAQDVAVSALPHGLSLRAVEAALRARTHLVDLVGEGPEKRRALDERARRVEALIVPGLGVAPGISNVCVGRGMELLDRTTSARIYVGGLPRRKEPPLFYQTVFRLESVLAAYRRPARIRRDGRDLTVLPFDEPVEALTFDPPVGSLEAIYTDGLASLPLTVGKRVESDLYEKTLRWPGHAAAVKVLSECGLLSAEPLDVEDAAIAPVRLLERVLRDRLQLSPEGDLLVLRVVVAGIRGGAPEEHVFDLVDVFDPERGHTAMARTTAFTATYGARAIASGELGERGVRFPEEIFLGPRFDALVAALAEKGVHVTHDVRSG